MAQLHHDPGPDGSEPRDARPRLRAVGLVCDRCAHEESLDDARLGGWHVTRDGRGVLCAGCVELLALELDDAVLYFPVCGHPVEHDGVLYALPACTTCDG